ncbi:MAG: hypothetical protein E6K29_13400 [Gammaproteobacteria bacterium]|nr:MAG: hypothetical protein E6K29_13400 [Gammaproteobacteria bacterium]
MRRTGKVMLKMTRSVSGELEVLLLEGKLIEPWTEELRAQVKKSPRIKRLDLSGVNFIDRRGAALLRRLESSGTEFIGASVFVRGLLDLPD